MSEEAIKQRKRRLVESVQRHFGMTADAIFRLDGNPFDLEFCDGFQTWKIRCVPGKVTEADMAIVRDAKLNVSYFRKAIAYKAENSKREFDLLRIE